jgi:hypothetical protein
MRRLLVLPVSVALLIAGGAVASTATATARGARGAGRTASPIIVCPLAGPGIVPCCGPPVATAAALPCCGAALPACPPNLTISAAPDPMAAGTEVVLSGALSRGTGTGTSVQLWQEPSGRHTFSKDGTAITDASGSWSITLASGTVMTNRSWYATADGIQSPTISEPVTALLTLAASRTRHSATVHGNVTPSHAGQRVLLQRLVGSSWVTIARPRLGRRSSFAVRYPYAPHVRATLRAVLNADSRNAMSVSPKLTAVVFPRVTAP